MPSEEGFYHRKGGTTNYISILSIKRDGRDTAVFAEKVAEGDEGAISRENKNGKIVWERYHDAVGMLIKGVYIKEDKEYGDQLCIRGKKFTIQVPFNSNHTKKFIAVCKNLDLSKPVNFEPWRMPREDKNGKPVTDSKGKPKFNSGWTIKQGGYEKEHKVKDELDLSKDGPVPVWVKLKNGKYDTSDHDEFLINYLNEWIEENELDKKPESAAKPKYSHAEEDDDDDDDDDDTDDDDDDDDDDEDEEEERPMKKAKAKVVKTTKLKKKKKKKPVAEDDDDDDDDYDDNDKVPF